MTKDELINTILEDLYRNSNRGMDFYDDFCVYENDIIRLEEVKTLMEREGLITNYKNQKTGISPLGFKICFEGGYLEERNRKERNIRRMLQKNKMEIEYLKKEIKGKNRTNVFLLLMLIGSITLVILMVLGIVNLHYSI